MMGDASRGYDNVVALLKGRWFNRIHNSVSRAFTFTVLASISKLHGQRFVHDEGYSAESMISCRVANSADF